MKTYAGIGSRETPAEVLVRMREYAIFLARRGWLLRSGAAPRADTSFEDGCDYAGGRKEIFLPWSRFNGSDSPLFPPTRAAFDLASEIHPNWSGLVLGWKKLHARNCHEVLGADLDDPVAFVLCWTPGGDARGGTATAMRLAHRRNIPVFNFWDEERWRGEFLRIVGATGPA